MPLKVVFSGVVAIVKNAATQHYRVILPATYPDPHPKPRLALDNKELRDHFPHVVLRFGGDLQPFVRFLPPGHSLHLDLSGQEPLSVDAGKMLRMEYALDATQCRLADEVADPKSADVVSAYMDIERGVLSTDRCGEWEIDGKPLGGPHDTYEVASDIVWTVSGSSQDLTLSGRPFGGGQPSELVKLPTGSQDVELRIQNFMAVDVWAQFRAHPGDHGPIDHDFRWYYQLLDGGADDTDIGRPRGWVKDRIQGRDLPVPRMAERAPGHGTAEKGASGVPPDGILGWTHNCMPALFPDTTW